MGVESRFSVSAACKPVILRQDSAFRTFLLSFVFMVIDVTIVLTVSVAAFYIFTSKIIDPVHKGFYCSDETIRHPFYHNTVKTIPLLVITLAGPFLVIVLAEALLFRRLDGTHKLPNYFLAVTHTYLEYLTAYALCTFMMEAMKCGFGRLRPHFVDICKPDWSRIDCSTDPDAFIEDAYCTSLDARAIRTARTSFPSGHTAAALFMLIFVHFYLARLRRAADLRSLHKLHLIIDAVSIVFFVFTAITRVTDRWHHVTDVLGGCVLALVCTAAPFILRSDGDILQERSLALTRRRHRD